MCAAHPPESRSVETTHAEFDCTNESSSCMPIKARQSIGSPNSALAPGDKVTSADRCKTSQCAWLLGHRSSLAAGYCSAKSRNQRFRSIGAVFNDLREALVRAVDRNRLDNAHRERNPAVDRPIGSACTSNPSARADCASSSTACRWNSGSTSILATNPSPCGFIARPTTCSRWSPSPEMTDACPTKYDIAALPDEAILF